MIGNSSAMVSAIELAGGSGATNLIHDVEDAKGSHGIIDVLDMGNLDYSVIQPGVISAECGRASVEWILRAGELAAAGVIQAIATAPINKEACKSAGYTDIGHMEIFQRQTGSDQVATMLTARHLRVVHLTTHRSLRVACDYVTKDNILAKIELTHRSFREWGFDNPRLGVAALTPHASDGGLIGDEEDVHIRPAVESACLLGIDATGPVPSDSLFPQAIDGKYDVVLAMYHDQGHIPIKVYDFARSISINLGLPFIRTSVDHGTAFDIAGKGSADSESMLECIKVAVSLASESRLH